MNDVKHSMDKKFYRLQVTLLYIYTIFYRTRSFAQTCRCTELAGTLDGMNIIHVQLSGTRYTRPL